MNKKCQHCGLPLGKQYVRAGQQLFHPQCFCCKHCGQRVQGDYAVHQGFVYHPQCVPRWGKSPSQALPAKAEPPAAHTALVCAVCQHQITGQYLYNNWGEQAHPHHGEQKTHQCSACSRFLSPKTHQGIQYEDGRLLCGLCQMTAVNTPEDVEPSRQRVLQTLSALGFHYIPDYLAITLSPQYRLNQQLKTHQNANSHGLTKTVEKRVNGQLAYREHSIFILYGLPRLVFEGVLAHELLHVWLNEHPHTRDRSAADTEGFCNLATAQIYHQDTTPLAAFLHQRMQSNPDPIYGEGYRQQQQRLQKIGWQGLRDYMQRPPGSFKQAFNKVDRWLDRFNL